MSKTSKFEFDLLTELQVLKYPTINANTIGLDTIAQISVINQTTTTPPGSNSNGDAYVIGSGATDDWSGHDGKFTWYVNGAWKIITPFAGMRIYDIALAQEFRYVNSAFGHSGFKVAKDLLLIADDFVNESGAAELTTTFTNFKLKNWEFTNGSSEEISTQFMIPRQMSNENVSVDIQWTTTANATGNIRWRLRFYRIIADLGQSINIGNLDTEEWTHTASGNTTPNLRVSSSSTFDLNALVTNRAQIVLKVQKQGLHVDDTFDQPLRLINVRLNYVEKFPYETS